MALQHSYQHSQQEVVTQACMASPLLGRRWPKNGEAMADGLPELVTG